MIVESTNWSLVVADIEQNLAMLLPDGPEAFVFGLDPELERPVLRK